MVKPEEKSMIGVRALHYIQLRGLLCPMAHYSRESGNLSRREVWLSYRSNVKFAEAEEEIKPMGKRNWLQKVSDNLL